MKSLAIALVTVLSWGCVPIQTATTSQPTPDAGSDVSDRDASSDVSDRDASSDVSAMEVDAGNEAHVESETSVPSFDGSDGPSLLGPCPDPCSAVGSFRCQDAQHLQICVAVDKCSSWTDVATCQADQVCCSAHCVSADAKNCYACGATCDGFTPICDKATKACGCDQPSCGALGKVCDGIAHQCATDPTRPEVYVDPSAGRNEDGSKEHPYRTITAALNAPRAAQSTLLVHVAKGRYDVGHGETFPLVLRGAFLDGEGTVETIIVGTGSYDARVGKGAINAQVSATVVIGDTARKSGIAKATIYEAAPTPMVGHYGVFCERGDAPTIMGTGSVTPTTTLDQVAIGPGYDIAVVATTTTDPNPSGCNLRATSSDFKQGSAGFWAIGCENSSGLDVGRTAVALQIGDGTVKGGNSIESPLIGSYTGVGVMVSGCAKIFSATYNNISNGQGGVRILQPHHMNEIDSSVLKSNTFSSLLEFGVKVGGGAAQVDDLSDNMFINVGPLKPEDPRGAGLYVEGIDDGSFPRIGKARGNSFLGNQWGVIFHTPVAILNPDGPPDAFHGNILHCNRMGYRGDDLNVVGGDFLIDGAFPAVLLFNLDDNEWDHAPPTTGTTAADGTDLTIIGTATATFAGGTAADPYSCDRL